MADQPVRRGEVLVLFIGVWLSNDTCLNRRGSHMLSPEHQSPSRQSVQRARVAPAILEHLPEVHGHALLIGAYILRVVVPQHCRTHGTFTGLQIEHCGVFVELLRNLA